MFDIHERTITSWSDSLSVSFADTFLFDVFLSLSLSISQSTRNQKRSAEQVYERISFCVCVCVFVLMCILFLFFSILLGVCVKMPTRRETIVFISSYFYWIRKNYGQCEAQMQCQENISSRFFGCNLWWRWKKMKNLKHCRSVFMQQYNTDLHHKKIPVRREYYTITIFVALLSLSE